MAGFYLTEKAKDDLKAIGRYTQNTWGREQKNRYLTLLDAAFQNLTANPLVGRVCNAIRQGYQQYGIGQHLLFYRQMGSEEIKIVRVLHERMDIEQHFLNL